MLLFKLSSNSASVAELAKWIPPLHMADLPHLSHPRIVRSHDAVSTPGFSRARKIVYLVRDPRAVVVSYYHHANRRNIPLTMLECSQLLTGDGIDFLGSWQFHVSQALRRAENASTKIIKYENMVKSPFETLGDAFEFIGIGCTASEIEEIVAETDISKLRSKRISAGVDGASAGDSDIRKGEADAWITECPQECQLIITENAKKEMTALGYC